MTLNKGFNPFRPGFGEAPPYLAGREDVQGRFRQILTEMSAGRPPAAATVMFGPRGMGKTVLLDWLRTESQKSSMQDNPIRTALTTPDVLTSPVDMWSRLLPKGWKKKFIPNAVTATFLGISATWDMNSSTSENLENALVKACKKHPLVFLMDEAHRMDPGLCRGILNLSQKARILKAPFLLVLAGTPDLEHLLSTVEATFVERSTTIGLGRLDTQSTADAIVKPLNKHDITITDDALTRVVENSQGYPYFIQEWGESLWDEAQKAKLSCLTDEQVDMVEPGINGKKQNFYAKRWSILLRKELLPVAQKIAEEFQHKSKYTENNLVSLIRDVQPADKADGKQISDILQKLVKEDFIWRPSDTNLFEAGIPSLMRYVLDQKREASPEASKLNQDTSKA